jgi:hypothetical protein
MLTLCVKKKMEPSSTTASIIAIIELCSEVIKYVNGTGATTGEMRLREEVRSCKSILQRLKDAADDTNKGKIWSETVKAVEAPSTPLYQLGIALGDIRAKLEHALEWPFDEKEVEKVISTIEREKALLVRGKKTRFGRRLILANKTIVIAD